jgi:hypothetical protein
VGKPRPHEELRVVKSGNKPMVDIEASQDRLGSLEEKDKIYCRRLSMSLSRRTVPVSAVSIECLPRSFK